MADLQASRAKLDEIDRSLCDLFQRRMAVCREVAAFKAENNLPVLDLEREQQVLASRAALAGDQALAPAVTALFETIMAQSRLLQAQSVAPEPEKQRVLDDCRQVARWEGPPLDSQRILYQGQPGAYCEEAALGFFGEGCDRTNLKTWDGVFRGVKEGFSDFGVVPIENSSTGSINDVYDLLDQFSCYIVGEQLVQVEHCLLAPEHASMKTISQVYTHEQGFLQCRQFLSLYPKWAHHEVANTALAAKLVAASADPSMAAIASHRAGELYGLRVLQTRINEQNRNHTRFIVVAAQPRFSPGANKISICFTVPHREGSLHRILGVFARAGLNLLKLESRPIPNQSWQYRFFVDFTGNLRDPSMDAVLAQLVDETASLRILGNYRAAEG